MVFIEDDDEVPGLDAEVNDYRLKMLAHLDQMKNPVPSAAVQEDLDANFDAFMDIEYADDQIGELEEVDNEQSVKPELVMDAVDEFIEDKKMWFRQLHKDHGDGVQMEVPLVKNSEQLRAVDIEDGEDEAEVLRMVREKQLANEQAFAEEAEAADLQIHEESDDEKAWDCETILSTYTNTDNHPACIKTTKRVKPRVTIEMHKAFRVPVDGLTAIAEEIIIEKKKARGDGLKAYEEASGSDSEAPEGALDKKEAKKQLKAENREKRRMKKQLKLAFAGQLTVNKRMDTNMTGDLRAGVSVKKIM